MSGANRVLRWSVIISALAITVGCAGSPVTTESDGLVLRQALQEREAAWTVWIRAVSRYCATEYDALEDRQRCVVAKQLDVELSRHFALLARAIPEHRPQHDQTTAGRLVHCEGNQRFTTCERLRPAVAEAWMGN